MGRPRKWASDAERKAAERAAVRPAIQAEQECRQVQAPKQRSLDADGRPATLRGLMNAAKEGTIILTEREERQIRAHFGYGPAEKRTYLERCAAAERMREKIGPRSAPGSTVTRYTLDGEPVEEPVGPAGLSLVAFPTQREGDLTPS